MRKNHHHGTGLHILFKMNEAEQINLTENNYYTNKGKIGLEVYQRNYYK